VINAARSLLPTIDITSAHALNHRAWSDEQQLDYATREKRIIVSENRADFYDLSRRYIAAGSAIPASCCCPTR
jgi:hypothetical protein